MKLFNKMAVIGVGLLGASLAKACKEQSLVNEISGYGRNRENLEKAINLISLIITPLIYQRP